MKLKEILDKLCEEEERKSLFEQRFNLDSFWITPRDEFIDIETHHYNWILLNYESIKFNVLDILGISEEDAREYGKGDWNDIPEYVTEKMEEIFMKMFEEGWIRGGYLKGMRVDEIVFQLTDNRARKEIFDKMLSIMNEVFSNPGSTTRVEIEFPFKGVLYIMSYEDFLNVESKKDLNIYGDRVK